MWLNDTSETQATAALKLKLKALHISSSRPSETQEYAPVSLSARQDSLPQAAQALTGRLSALPVLPLSQGEIDQVIETFLPALFDDPHAVAASHPVSDSSRDDYIERIVAGGFPIPLAMTDQQARNRWFDNYVRLNTLPRPGRSQPHPR